MYIDQLPVYAAGKRILTIDDISNIGASSFVYTTDVGNGTVGPYTITHNFGSKNVIVVARKNAGMGLRTEVAPNESIFITPTFVDDNTIRLSPVDPWGVDEFSVTVVLVAAATAPSPVADLPISGFFSTRPSPGTNGRLFFAIDNGKTYRDNVTSWDCIASGDPWPGSPGDQSLWTAVNLGTATAAHDRDTVVLTAPANASTSNVRQYVRALPASSGYTVTVRLDLSAGPNGNYWDAGLALRNSTSGALILFALRYGDGLKVNVSKYNSATSYNSAYATPSVSTFPTWLRIRDNGTSRFFEYSYNGWDWTLVTSHPRSDFTIPNQVGIAADPYSQTASIRLRSLNIT